MQALRYAIDEALKSLWRGRQSGILSTATIALALFVLGALLLITSNLERLGDEWSTAAEMSVYLADDISAEDRSDIEHSLAPDDIIVSYDYISKSEALRRFKQTFADVSNAVDAFGENPLPASYEVRLHSSNASGSGGAAIDSLAERLRLMHGVTDVRYDRQWLNRLAAATRVVRSAGLVLAGLLTVAAALTVANVVRLALHARRDELEIMHLVGAPGVYVQGPFVMEGVLQGGIGALAAIGLLGVTFLVVRGRYLASIATAINLPAVQFLPVEVCFMLILGGMAVGCLGGLVAGRITQS